MRKLHTNINLNDNERDALRAVLGICRPKMSMEDFVTRAVKEKIAQYNQQLSAIDKEYVIDILDKDTKIQ